MALGVQQREQEIALLRAIAATPGQIRRMIAWEATIVALIGSAAGIYPGLQLGRELADGLVRHGIAPPEFAVSDGRLAAAGVLVGSVAVALLAVWGAGRRASRIAADPRARRRRRGTAADRPRASDRRARSRSPARSRCSRCRPPRAPRRRLPPPRS